MPLVHPPGQVPAGPLLLRRTGPDDAEISAVVVAASLEHLRPFLPWATDGAATLPAQLARLQEAAHLWETGTDYVYAMLTAGGALAGNIGLHRRVGDGGMEIGYWVAAHATGRGYATAAAGALTAVAMALPGVTRVEIHCDETNLASAAVPRKLGYRLDRIDRREREAPAETGRRMIWVWDAAAAPG
jgi:RimJ/RimL family protein N-acetyltransferase